MNPSTTNSPTSTTPGGHSFPWPNPAFDQNRNQFLARERNAWVGRHVAWSWDGCQIIAGSDTLAGLYGELRLAGIDPKTVVFDFIEVPQPAGG